MVFKHSSGSIAVKLVRKFNFKVLMYFRRLKLLSIIFIRMTLLIEAASTVKMKTVYLIINVFKDMPKIIYKLTKMRKCKKHLSI